MDASYEVVGASVSDRESDQSGEDVEEEEVNGEEVKRQIKDFMATSFIRTAISGLGFAMGVIGIWGDGTETMVFVEA